MGAFSKFAGKKEDKKPSGFGDFAKWVYDKATSHPIDQIESTLKTGKAPQKQQPEASSGSGRPAPSSPTRPEKTPEMLKSKYWRPGR